MAKGAPAPVSSDDSADEVANHFSSRPKSQSGNKIESKTSSSLKKSSRQSRQAEEEEEPESDEEKAAAPPTEDEASNKEDSEEEEEYEIEKILDVKVGAIPESPDEICYYVHWKGYDSSEDSWTTESNAEGARELIRVFWKSRKRAGKPLRDELLENHAAKKARKKAGRKSNATPSVKKVRPSSVGASSEDLGDVAQKRPATVKNGAKSQSSTPLPATTKRRRSSIPKADEMEVDEERVERSKSPMQADNDDPPPSKKRKSGTSARNGKQKPKDETEVEAPAEANEANTADVLIKQTMAKFGKLKNWDDIVAEIKTVEQRPSDGKLQIFFNSDNGDECVALSSEFSRKSPLKLIAFYESNLKWRPTDP